MNDMYVQGFVDKCAELEVDPEALVKASSAIASRLMTLSDDALRRLSPRAAKYRQNVVGGYPLTWGINSDTEQNLWRRLKTNPKGPNAEAFINKVIRRDMYEEPRPTWLHTQVQRRLETLRAHQRGDYW